MLIALTIVAACVVVLPWLAPYDPGRQFAGYPYAPPMRPHVIDEQGRWRMPFAYALRSVDPIERTYVEERSRAITFGDARDPWFLLGSDALGRDELSRLLAGARLSLGVALLSTLLALLIGGVAGAIAGYAGGWLDAVLMRIADFVLVLPGIYVALALRGALPSVLSIGDIVIALVIVLALAGWPSAARGVRGIVIVQGREEYAEAARALGASAWRVIWRHLLPSTRGFLAVQASVLLPAFIVTEATLSFVGLGFAPPAPSWGAMLREAASVRIIADAPWLFAPSAAIFITVLLVHAVGESAEPISGSHLPYN
jgi:peptide/nickel transport system permease protein